MSIDRSNKSSTRNLHVFAASIIFAFLICGSSAMLTFAQTNTAADKIGDTKISPEQLSASFAEIAKRVEPAVVNIDTKGKMPDVTLKNDKPTSDEASDIMEFFRRQLPRRPSYSVGSGFIVDKTGFIMTNLHVVDDASRITVRLQSGAEYQAKVVGADEPTDLAILKIEAGRDLPFIKLGNSEQARIGDWVLAIGSPFGLAQTVTAGIISQTKRETPQASLFQKFIQTDAAINRGNSGGPLVSMSGEVIGINSQIATLTGDYNGIGFALPSNEAANVYRQIVQGGKVRRGYLGVYLDSVKAEFAKVYGLDEARGAIVTSISDKQSAAAAAGLQSGDIILEYDGEKISDATDLIQRVASTTPDKEINLVYLREVGDRLERKTTLIKPAERPSNNKIFDDETPVKLSVDGQKKTAEPFGLTLAELTPQIAAVYKIQGEKGLIIKNINPASYIADVKNSNGTDSALSEGDVIQRINRVPAANLKSFSDVAAKLKTGDAVVLHVLSYSPGTKTTQTRIVQFTVQ